jgi:AraC-like DNA-binding protein
MSDFRMPECVLYRLRAVSIDPAILFHKSELPRTLSSLGDGMISSEQFFRLWHVLGDVSDDPGIGLRMGSLNPRHPASIAARHARTFRDALPHLACSLTLDFSEQMRIVETHRECSVEFTGAMLNEAAPPLFVDAAFTITLETARQGMQQPLHPSRVELTRSPRHEDIYEGHYGCRIRFKAPRNAIVFEKNYLELPFATYNPAVLAALRPTIQREIARQKTRQSISCRVQRVLMRSLGGPHTDIHAVAMDLGMSSRTLQRRIAEEGGSFRQLLSAARRELARVCLQHPSLGLVKTACLLGYEDPNSFFRAFRAWEGVTPSEWRAMRRLENSQ